jgi:hypothetical protein
MVKIEIPDSSGMAPSPVSGQRLTREGCAKGGQATSVYKSLAQSLKMRKKCSISCPFFESCPVNAMSLGYVDPKSGVKGLCLMKDFPMTVRQQFLNLFLTGEEGIIKAIKDALHMYMMEVDTRGTLRDKRDMIDLMLRFYKEVYNAPRGNRAQAKEPLTITIRRVGVQPQTISVTGDSSMPVPLADMVHPRNDDITEGDPESLLLSPNLGRIIGEEIKIETNMERFLDDGMEE